MVAYFVKHNARGAWNAGCPPLVIVVHGDHINVRTVVELLPSQFTEGDKCDHTFFRFAEFCPVERDRGIKRRLNNDLRQEGQFIHRGPDVRLSGDITQSDQQ